MEVKEEIVFHERAADRTDGHPLDKAKVKNRPSKPLLTFIFLIELLSLIFFS